MLEFWQCASPLWHSRQSHSRESIRLIHHAYDLGINLIDNANRYTGGVAEEIHGRAMKGRRTDFVVATKLVKRVGHRPNDEGLSRVHIMQEVENILRRLDTDYVDLLQAHDCGLGHAAGRNAACLLTT
ncbi:aldo/keto reductase [Paenibacillus xerothermodurans]|uniref:Aldo/keto reductase n=1 Tax=Paenibacillus xerothermodurans TaxID=1977292 RepID=A0A2W1NF94_PAEXE|nr:aldo/keto reductase [Paenibacillus xerothermodurans]PZE21741.1 aldo/keto reductase [Paenibacillus xerothermodurans]